MVRLKKRALALLQRAGLIQLYFGIAVHRMVRGREEPPATDADGMPIPPLALMAQTVAHADWRAFLKTGEATAAALNKHASEAGLSFAQSGRILDLGCGAGRVIRHLPKMTKAELFGADYNRAFADWCAANLPGNFSSNGLNPPLEFPNAHFDIVYLLSVFTHLRLATQRRWLAELRRVIRPGGLALVSFHEETQPGFPQTDEAAVAIRDTGVYVHLDLVEGSNLIATFQTRAQSECLFGEAFEVVRMIARDETSVGQSLAVLRRPLS